MFHSDNLENSVKDIGKLFCFYKHPGAPQNMTVEDKDEDILLEDKEEDILFGQHVVPRKRLIPVYGNSEIFAPHIQGGEWFSRFLVRVIAFLFPPELFSVGVTEISVKTGDESSAGTDAGADLEICDGLGNCCQTLGLGNHGHDRQKGQIDVNSGSESEVRHVTVYFLPQQSANP